MGYDTPDVPAKQRAVVVPMLEAMRNGESPKVFQVAGEALRWIRDRSEMESVSLLDAGCASAYYSEVVAHYVGDWAEYAGMDSSPYMIEEAATHYPGIRLYCADVTKTDFEDRAFDVVMSAATINHVREWKAALRELMRITGKWLLLHRLPLIDEIDKPTRYEQAEAYGHEVLAVYFNRRDIRQILLEQFDNVSVCYWDNLATEVWERK